MDLMEVPVAAEKVMQIRLAEAEHKALQDQEDLEMTEETGPLPPREAAEAAVPAAPVVTELQVTVVQDLVIP